MAGSARAMASAALLPLLLLPLYRLRRGLRRRGGRSGAVGGFLGLAQLAQARGLRARRDQGGFVFAHRQLAVARLLLLALEARVRARLRLVFDRLVQTISCCCPARVRPVRYPIRATL